MPGILSTNSEYVMSLKSIEDVHLYYTEVNLETLAYWAGIKSSSNASLQRQTGICAGMVHSCLRFGLWKRELFGKPNLRRLMLSLTEESTFEQVRNSVFEIFVSDVRTGPKPKQEVPNGNAGTKM